MSNDDGGLMLLPQSALTPFLLSGVIAAVLGCAGRSREPSEAAARASIVGMTPRQVASCMGRPGTRLREGNVASWSYSSPGGSGPYVANQIDPTDTEFDYSPFGGGVPSSSFNDALAPPPRAAWTVQIIFDGGRVGAVSFQPRDGEARLYAQQCGAI